MWAKAITAKATKAADRRAEGRSDATPRALCPSDVVSRQDQPSPTVLTRMRQPRGLGIGVWSMRPTVALPGAAGAAAHVEFRCRDSGAPETQLLAARGSHTSNTAPDGEAARSMAPLLAANSERAIESPSPVPPASRRLVKNGSNRRSRSAAGTPG